MEDFIYLILLIAWVVFAFYRKSQKKNEAAQRQQKSTRPQGEPRQIPSWEDIILGKEPVFEKESPPVPEVVLTDGMSPVLRETSFEKEYNRLGITSIEEMDKPVVREDSLDANKQEEEIMRKKISAADHRIKIDLRQAVIYSEILNRPYV
jgi:hypothetical protein